MNQLKVAAVPNRRNMLGLSRHALPYLVTLAIATGLTFTVGCSGEKADQEPTVTVQVAPVEKTAIEHTVSSQAVLFARQQAAIVPKISAPVQKFLVKRGSKVRQGQLLAVLENRDLSAAAQENKGSYEQAQAAYETTTGASSYPIDSMWTREYCIGASRSPIA